MIIQTVALPVYKGKKIAWIAMESLCNQIEVDYEWELIICEEKHDQQLGEKYFKEYKERLMQVGCERIKYIELENWIPLSKKWGIIGRNVSNTSKSFLLQPVDCYSHPIRLKETKRYINDLDYDWFDYAKGYFYNFLYKKLIFYENYKGTKLDKAFKTQYAKTIPQIDKRRSIDKFLINHVRNSVNNFKMKYIAEIRNGVYIDGFNNISVERYKHFIKPKGVFSFTDIKLEDLVLPEYIKHKIYKLTI